MSSKSRIWRELFLGQGLDKLEKACIFMIGLLIFFLMLYNFYGTILRYFFRAPVVGMVDLSEYLFVLVVFGGLGHAFRKGIHLRMAYVVSRLSHKINSLLGIISSLIILVFAFIFTWRGWILAWSKLYQYSDTEFKIPLFPVYLILPLGNFLLGLEAVLKLREYISLLWKPNDTT